MNARRWLLTLLVLAAGAGVYRKVEAAHFFPPPAAEECPPGDRVDWNFDPARRRADRIEWIVLEPHALYEVCRAWTEAAAVTACASTRPDYELGGNRGIVYSLVPREFVPEWFRLHEDCHTQGHQHGPLYF